MQIMPVDRGVRFGLADLSVEVVSTDAAFLEELSKAYGAFPAEHEPDVRLRVIFFPQPAPTGLAGDSVRFAAGRDGRSVSIYVMENGDSSRVMLLGAWLHFVFRHVMNTQRLPQLLLHSAGAVFRETGMLFTGPSNAGKTTLARMLATSSLPLTLLGDETVAVEESAGGYTVFSTPLRGEVPAGRRISAPLGAVFMLKQAASAGARRLTAANAVRRLEEQLTPHFKFAGLSLDTCRERSMLRRLSGSIPCFELAFRKDDLSFWPRAVASCFDERKCTQWSTS